MAEPLSIIQTVSSLLSIFTLQGLYNQLRGPDKSFSSILFNHLTQLQSTIRLVESFQLKDHEKKWLQQLKDDTYEIKDILDEFEYLDFTYQIQPKLHYYLSSSRRTVKKLIGCNGPVNRMKKLLSKLDSILGSSDRLVRNTSLNVLSGARVGNVQTDRQYEELVKRLPELHGCIAFCGIFPKGWMFDREKLVRMWMANDFIEPPERNVKRWEELCYEYFRELESISFFQPIMKGEKKLYLLNDSKYDLVQSISTTDCMRLEGTNVQNNIPSTIRYLSVTTKWLLEQKNWNNIESIRTLVIIKDPSHPLEKIENQLLRKLKKLLVLDLSECELTDLPESVGQLIHLRYLALCKTLSTVPRSFAKLYHLQTLCIPHDGKIVELPKGIRNLIKMRHLDVNPLCISKINGIGAMVDLMCSVELHVKEKEGHKLEELKDLEGIGGELTIRCLENVAGMEEACRAKMKDKKRVKSLHLEWSRYRKNVEGCAVRFTDVEVLEGCEPSPDVEKLHIENYYGCLTPKWLMEKVLHNLKCMHLTNCQSWQKLPPLGDLPNLEVLYIKEMSAIKHIGPEFYGREEVTFPKLEKLAFESMQQWAKWSSCVNKRAFPVLKELLILSCPKLDEMPSVPATVRIMEVRGTRIIPHFKLCYSGSSESQKLSIETSSLTLFDWLLDEEHIKNIEALAICQSEVAESELSIILAKLKALITLQIIGCPKIELIPPMRSQIALRQLHVRDCEILSSLPVLSCSLSLQALIIERCPKFSVSSLPSSNLKNLCSLKQFSISHCPEFQSLPDGEFPSSLWLLSLIGCAPSLKMCLLSGTNNWCKKISSIPRVVIL